FTKYYNKYEAKIIARACNFLCNKNIELSTIMALEYALNSKISKDNIKVYTFGSSRTGSVSFSKFYDKYIPFTYRGVVYNDVAAYFLKCSGCDKINSYKDDNKTLNVKCYKDENDVYIPFKQVIKKQFDVSGKLNQDIFEWTTSYAKVKIPEKIKYNTTGAFGHFASYKVEKRSRVKCISGEENVPMSIQWDNKPYYYVIQICQYALQHYSVYTGYDKKPEKLISQPYFIYSKNSVITIKEEFNQSVLTCKSENGSAFFNLRKDPVLSVLSFIWKPENNNQYFSILAKDNRFNMTAIIYYIFGNDDRCVWVEEKSTIEIYYTLGNFEKKEYYILRDILVDVYKGLLLTNKKNLITQNPFKIGDVTVLSLTLHFKEPGFQSISNTVNQSSTAEMEMFMKAADWLVKNQEEDGGWNVSVPRSIADNKLLLQAGWRSAMGQGHALSVLSRAYNFSNGKKEYYNTGLKSLNLFKKNASQKGVINNFFGYKWYEEYPTTPGTFVLNGFLYSLIGLYDFSKIKNPENDAESLFNDGIKSLKALLPLYDTGSGSLYDLRHVGIGTAPNLARWDYHAVHVYLLKWICNIIKDCNDIDTVANRWIAYSNGIRAKHN
uniref:heparosan-N-sulfate-glucuronate 5-epimerase n=2 Tax=Strongyloides stercoralis TaxID=6248 RepID=A0AAF5DKY6_STRER